MSETCPYCGCKITSGSLTCPCCGKSLPIYPAYPSSVTTVSGETYEFTSGSTATMTFTHISDKYQKDQYAKIPEVQLIDGKTVTKEDLIYFEKLGFLRRDQQGTYELTDAGRKAYKENREFKEKWDTHTKKTIHTSEMAEE